jgi:hypothetical protein
MYLIKISSVFLFAERRAMEKRSKVCRKNLILIPDEIKMKILSNSLQFLDLTKEQKDKLSRMEDAPAFAEDSEFVSEERIMRFTKEQKNLLLTNTDHFLQLNESDPVIRFDSSKIVEMFSNYDLILMREA